MSARGTRTIDNTVTYDANFPDPLAAGNCLVTIDASGIQHDVIRQPPHYLMKAVTDHCRATVMYARAQNNRLHCREERGREGSHHGGGGDEEEGSATLEPSTDSHEDHDQRASTPPRPPGSVSP